MINNKEVTDLEILHNFLRLFTLTFISKIYFLTFFHIKGLT